MFKLAQFVFCRPAVETSCFLTFDLNFFCRTFVCFISFLRTIFFFALTNAETAWREREAVWQTYREVGIRKVATGVAKYSLFHYCALHTELVPFHLFCWYGLPSCMWKGLKIHGTLWCDWDVCRASRGNFPCTCIKGNSKRFDALKSAVVALLRVMVNIFHYLWCLLCTQIVFMKPRIGAWHIFCSFNLTDLVNTTFVHIRILHLIYLLLLVPLQFCINMNSDWIIYYIYYRAKIGGQPGVESLYIL